MTTHRWALRPRLISVGLITLLVAACGGSTPSASPIPSAQPSALPPSASPVPSGGPSSAPPSESPATTGWQPSGSMVLARLGGRAAMLKDGTVLVVGNEPCVAAGEPTDSQRAEIFDPATGTWSEVESLNKERADLALVALSDGRAMVLGGTNPDSQPYSSTKVYAPTGRSWADGPLMLRAGATQAVTLPNGDVLAVGPDRAEMLKAGATAWKAVKGPAGLESVDAFLVSAGDPVLFGEGADGSGPVLRRFDVAGQTWTSIEAPNVLRPQLVALADGSMLAFGDDEGGARVERYDPAKKTWIEPKQMSQGRVRPQVTLLPDGRVLVAGGVELRSEPVDGGYSVTEGAPLASTEIYDPTADSWSAGPALLSPRQAGHAMTPPDGSVVVFGGFVESPPGDDNPDTGTPGPCSTPLATTERLGPTS